MLITLNFYPKMGSEVQTPLLVQSLKALYYETNSFKRSDAVCSGKKLENKMNDTFSLSELKEHISPRVLTICENYISMCDFLEGDAEANLQIFVMPKPSNYSRIYGATEKERIDYQAFYDAMLNSQSEQRKVITYTNTMHVHSQILEYVLVNAVCETDIPVIFGNTEDTLPRF